MINVWIAFRGDFVYPDPDGNDTPQQAANRAFLTSCHDYAVIGGIYRKEDLPGPSQWTLASGYWLDEATYDPLFAQLQSDNPGRTRELAAWDAETGAKIREPHYPQLIQYMPDVWNGDEPPTFSPATELTDVNFLAGYETARDFS